MPRTVGRLGRLDVAFNDAGVENEATLLHEIDLAGWDCILGSNLRATFLCMRHEIAQMVALSGALALRQPHR